MPGPMLDLGENRNDSRLILCPRGPGKLGGKEGTYTNIHDKRQWRQS